MIMIIKIVWVLLLADANLLLPVTFPQWTHLAVGICRRWLCTVSLSCFMDLTDFKDFVGGKV